MNQMPTRISRTVRVNTGNAHWRLGINPWATRLAILAYLILVGGLINSQIRGDDFVASRSTYFSMLSRKPVGSLLSQCEFTSVKIVKTHCVWPEKGQWSPCRVQIVDGEGNELFYQQVDSMSARKYQTSLPLITIPDMLGSQLDFVRQEIGDIALAPPYSLPSSDLERVLLYNPIRNADYKWLGYNVYLFSAQKSTIKLLATFSKSDGHNSRFRTGGWSISNRYVSFGDDLESHIYDSDSGKMYSISSNGSLIPTTNCEFVFLLYDSLHHMFELADFSGSVIDSLEYEGRSVIPISAHSISQSCFLVICLEPYGLFEEITKGVPNGFGLYLLDFSTKHIKRLRDTSGDSHIFEVTNETDEDVH